MAYIIKDDLGEYVNLAQITELTSLLVGTNIPFELTYLWKTPHIEYPSKENCVFSVICHSGAFGADQGLLEIMYCDTQEVEGYLTAKQIYEKIKKHDSLTNKRY